MNALTQNESNLIGSKQDIIDFATKRYTSLLVGE